MGCRLNRNAERRYELRKDLPEEYNLDLAFAAGAGIVGQESDLEEKQLKLQLSELKKSLNALEHCFVLGEIIGKSS